MRQCWRLQGCWGAALLPPHTTTSRVSEQSRCVGTHVAAAGKGVALAPAASLAALKKIDPDAPALAPAQPLAAQVMNGTMYNCHRRMTLLVVQYTCTHGCGHVW